jgi:hypothetical protein
MSNPDTTPTLHMEVQIFGVGLVCHCESLWQKSLQGRNRDSTCYQGYVTCIVSRVLIEQLQSCNIDVSLDVNRYRMDYMKFVNHHRLTQADITIACLPVDEERAKGFGLMKIDDQGLIKVRGMPA